jgi:hypothetical protein
MRIIMSLVRPISRCDGCRPDVRYWPLTAARSAIVAAAFGGKADTTAVSGS